MRVGRTNPSLKGLGCGCGCGTCTTPTPPTLSGIGRLGMDRYAVISWEPPGQGTSQTMVQTPGSTAQTLLTAPPDGGTSIGRAVNNAFSNNYGGAQPGVLPLYPNATADNLSFVKAPPPSLQCQLVETMNANPLLFVAGTALAFYLLNHGKHVYRAHKERKRAAKAA